MDGITQLMVSPRTCCGVQGVTVETEFGTPGPRNKSGVTGWGLGARQTKRSVR